MPNCRFLPKHPRPNSENIPSSSAQWLTGNGILNHLPHHGSASSPNTTTYATQNRRSESGVRETEDHEVVGGDRSRRVLPVSLLQDGVAYRESQQIVPKLGFQVDDIFDGFACDLSREQKEMIHHSKCVPHDDNVEAQ
ncbi:hypothetical protein M8818_005778 [Zalaria obscura]|uniref:Uncharacterized protein n=1 Tax=Zalaria obscura TaxID=2024903 RepID=A0ACC3S8X6_9PEZI